MAQTIAGISNVHNVEVNHSEFNITVNQGMNPDDIRQITAWLTPINFREIQIDTFSKRTPETGIWFIKSAEYQTWLSNSSGFLWVNGSPGAGKTVLSSIIIDHLQERFSSDSETAIVFAYCRYTDLCSVTDIFASFVKQLVQDHPSVLPIIKAVYLDHQRKETRLCERKLQELLQELLTSFKRTYIAIDALDEVSDDTRATLLTVLSLLRASRASLLVTSRPLHLFEPHLPDAYVQVEAKNQKDIELFIDKQIKETPRLRVVLEGKQHDREMISVILKDKSQGMFLLTALQIDGLKGCTTIKTLRGAIESLPSGLNALYECTCSRIKSQTKEEVSLATKAIIWLTYAYRSMKITELQHALAVSDGFDEEDVAVKEMIVSVCCGLIVVDEQSGIVRLVHYTAYDFFKKFSSDICATPHTLITTSCLAYLSAFDFVEQELSSERELEEFLSTQPLLRYAYDHWGSHSKACRGEAGLPAAVFTFLNQLDIYPYLSDDNSFDLLSPVHIGATYGFLDALPATGDSCNQVTRIRRYTPLILASANGHEEMVELLLSRHDVDINSQGENGRTALSEACENSYGGTVELLLSRNDVDINSEDADGQTALFAASKTGDEEIVKSLLSRKDVDINIATKNSPFGDPNGQTALFSASMKGHEEVVKLLLSRSDIDINITTKYSIFGDASGQTALFAASKNGHEGIVRLLLSRTDLNIHSRTEYGETSLFAASEEGHEEIVKLLLSRGDVIINTITTKYGPSCEPRGRTPLFAASRNGHEAVVELFLSREDIDVHSQTEDGQTALLVASKNGHDRIVELFLSRDDVDPNSQHAGGQSALFAASENSSEGVVKLLLARTDVDVNIATKSSLFGEPSGQTALFAACRKGHKGIVEMLLSRNNVDINSENADGQTALFTASERGHEGIVELLLSRTDVSINTTTSEPRGQTALFAACKNGRQGTVELLLSRNDIDVHSQTEDGQTALFVASQYGREKIVKLFLSRDDIDLNLQNADCQSVLFAASENGHEGVVKLLLSRTDVDVNITTKNISFEEPNGQTSLFTASKNGYEGVVKLLLSRSDVDVNITTKYNPFGEAGGQTALFAASENGHEGVVKLLLSRPDVNVSITTKYNPFWGASGQTALFAASKNGHEGIVELLLSRNDIDIHSKTGDGQTSLFAATKNGHEGIVQLLRSRAFRAVRFVSLTSHLS